MPAFAPITVVREYRRDRRGVGWLVACVLGAVLAASCWKPVASPSTPAPAIAATTVKITTIKNVAGRLDWSKSNVIAFDQIGSDGYFDVFTMNPDGSDERCLTCDQPALPNRHIGNPAWHPSGNYLVMQVEKPDTPKNIISDLVASPGSGINNNVWVMDVRATTFTQLTDVPLSQGGVLHPHFSPSGNALLWAERLSAQGGSIGTWALKVADFSTDGGPHVSNVRTLQPGQQHLFYESSSFSPDGRTILFSGNLEPGQSENDMDIYTLNLDSGALSNLTNTPTQWDEHAQMSPVGDRIVWMSSSGVGGAVDSIHPLTDYWMMKPDGSEKTQISYFNDPNHAEYVGRTGATAADSSWSPDGTKLMAAVILDQLSNNARTVLLEFSTAIQPSNSVPDAQPQVVDRAPARSETVVNGMTLTTRASDRSPYEVRLAVADDDAAQLDEWSGTVDRWFADRALDRTSVLLDPLASDRRHERFTQIYQGVPVFGGEIARQQAGQRTVSILGTFYTNLSIETVPTLTSAQARDLLLKQPGMAGALVPDSGRLVVLPRRDGTYNLAYSVRAVTPDDLVISFVDAHSGDLLEWYSDFQGGGRRSLLPASARTSSRFASLSAMASAFESSTTYDFRGLAQTTFDLLGGSGSRVWMDSFAWSSRGPADSQATAVDANARVATSYLAQRLGTDLFAGGRSPLQIVHPDDPRAGAGRPGLFAKGPFYAGKSVSIFPDASSGVPAGAEEPFSLQAVAHELGHALLDSTSRLLNRGEAGILNEGIAELIGRSAAVSAGGRDAGLSSAGPAASDPLVIAWIVETAAHRAAADGVSVRPNLERAFLRAAAFMLPTSATLQMARVATLQAARDLDPGGPTEGYLRTAWNDAGVQ